MKKKNKKTRRSPVRRDNSKNAALAHPSETKIKIIEDADPIGDTAAAYDYWRRV